MSHVSLIAADKELPIGDTSMVVPHKYYRAGVDDLGLDIKPFQYELCCENCQSDLDRLLAYLRENFSPGEEVELWSLWVGSGAGRVRRYRGKLPEFDLDTLGMLYELQREPDFTGEFDDLICQVCVTVEI